ncbi:methylosome protein WDR77-like [Oncorhynchus masou masou]|uniref:methylosome protein WDR77-like n=1 Tax=Oncorhynchus masou masou TaxID=90313 RepID=UPI003183CB9E
MTDLGPWCNWPGCESILTAAGNGSVVAWFAFPGVDIIALRLAQFFLFSACCRIKVWDLIQGEVVSTYNAHSKPVTCVSCNPSDDSLFLSCGQDGRLLLWDRRKPTKPASRLDVEPSCCPTSVAWHPHHRTTIAYGDELGRVTLKDFQGTEPGQTQSTHSRRVSGLAFSSHSAPLLASISDDCTVAVMNSALKETLRDKRHQDFVRGVCWAPGGSDTLTTVGWDHQVLHHIMGQDGPTTGYSTSPL